MYIYAQVWPTLIHFQGQGIAYKLNMFLGFLCVYVYAYVHFIYVAVIRLWVCEGASVELISLFWQLLQIRRVAETDWTSKNVLPVSFATLVAANKDKTDVVDLRKYDLSQF